MKCDSFCFCFYATKYNFQAMQMDSRFKKSGQGLKTDPLWKTNNEKAKKNGGHGNVYWVKKEPLNEDGSEKSNRWRGSNKYVGDWKDNKKNGFGIQYFQIGDKYEGGWFNNKRHGQGTFWVSDAKNKLRREYTGDWENDVKQGRGTMFYKTGDRYDGMWMDNLPHGEGRMIYSNGDVYEGMWYNGKRSGYGVLTKRCGDHFEGHWVNDMREGQGSYFFAEKNKIFVGEWVDDTPKTGVYSEVEDPTTVKVEREKHFTDPYILPEFDQIGLENPTDVLEESIEKVRKNRTIYRARNIPLDQLYTRNELLELEKDFGMVVNRSDDKISELSLEVILNNLGIALERDEIVKYLRKINPDYNAASEEEEIDFEMFVRMVAMLLELRNINKETEVDVNLEAEEDEDEENKWYNQKE